MNTLPQHSEETAKHFAGYLNNLYIQDHQLIKCNTICSLEKLSTGDLYHMQTLLKYGKPICHDYHKEKFDEYNFNWELT